METVVKELKVHYEVAGQGETVLLLHGWGSSMEPYRPLMALLQQKYTVIALDLPGFGKTEEPKAPMNVDDYVDFVLEFLKMFPVEKLSLVGHSFGGRVIIKMANRPLPFTIPKIVLIDSAGIKPQPSGKKTTKQTVYKMGKWFATRKLIARCFPGLLEKLRVTFGSADYAAASPMMRQCLVRVVNEDLSHLLPGITPPTLLVWGENDTATPLEDAKTIEKLIPDAGLCVLSGAGHFSYLDRPGDFGVIANKFLENEVEK